MTKPKLVFRELGPQDLDAFKAIRLEAIRTHPEAFLGSYEEESQKEDAFFLDMMARDRVFGCFKHGALQGIIGYYVITPEGKRSHSAKIWGFYIRPEYRGRGFARKLFQIALDDMARAGEIEKALLKVNARNHGAVRLYRSMGFEIYGLEKRSLKVGKRYYDDYLMSRML